MVSAISIELQIRPRQLDIKECDIQNVEMESSFRRWIARAKC